MYSFFSKAVVNQPQYASESGACGSSSAATRRALACAEGTNNAPDATSRGSTAQRPSKVIVWWPSLDAAEYVTFVARNASIGVRASETAMLRKAMPCRLSFSATMVAYAAGTM